MKKFKLILCLLLALTSTVFAQNARFTNQGVIQFEKRVNMYAIFKEQIKRYPNETYYAKYFEEYQKTNPQFKVLKSTLSFNNEQTLFKPIEETEASNSFFGNDARAQQNNIVLTNTAKGTSIAQKKVYEDLYLVRDSTRKINWKITDEFRNIAGFDCRRANALIMDSIYVVAFYTDQIPVSGGPESFTGLPGMILGVALPYENTTWFATSILDQPVPVESIKAPTKGKPSTNAQLHKILMDALKDWGKSAQDALKAFSL